MSQLLFSNILVSKLKNNINLADYQNNHPAGDIGTNYKILKSTHSNILPFSFNI